MALVRNMLKHAITLTYGSIQPGEDRNIDPDLDYEASLLATGDLLLVDAGIAPPPPPSREVAVHALKPYADITPFEIDLTAATPGQLIGVDGLPKSAGGSPRVAKYVDDFGSDPTGVADSTAAFNAAVAALPTVTINNGAGGATATYPVGRIKFGSGTYKLGVSADTVNLGPFVGIDGPGQIACLIKYYGATRCFRTINTIYGTNGGLNLNFAGLAPYTNWSPGFDGFTIDGANSTSTAIGLWIGDIEGASLGPSLTIQNFTKTGQIGLLFYSENSWHEKLTGSVNIYNCKTLVQNGIAAPAHFYGGDLNYSDLRFNIFADAGQDVFAQYGGASFYHGSLVIRGNTCEGVTNTGAVIRLAGGAIFDTSRIEVTVEAQAIDRRLDGSAAGTITHKSIVFGDPTVDYVRSCWGVLDFGNFNQSTNWTRIPANKPFSFDGLIHGDNVLNPMFGSQNPPPPVPFTSTMHRTVQMGIYDPATSSIDLSSGDYFNLGQLTGDLTLLFRKCETSAARTIYIRVQQGSNQRQITWPSNGSPSADSPIVLWESGVPPVLSRTNGSVDMFELWTVDGQTWYGKQRAGYAFVRTPVYTLSHVNDFRTTASMTLNISQNTVANSTLILCVANLVPASGATPTITDTKGNTWVIDKTVGAAGAVLWLAHAVNASALTTADHITVTWSASTACYATMLEVTGLAAKKLDVVGTVDQGVTSAAAITPQLPNDTNAPAEIAVLFAACGNSNVGNPSSWTATDAPDPMGPWTNVDAFGTHPAAVWFTQVPATGKQLRSTITPSGSQPMTALLATYS
jgi:hypothetical protein